MPSSLLVFCAPTLESARRAAWAFVAKHPTDPLDPPLVLGRRAGAPAWRDLARKQPTNSGALMLPRLVTPESYFARFHASNARRRSWSGLNRLWTLAKALRGVENGLEHLDFDSNDTGALREMAALIAQMRRQGRAALPSSDDAYERELDLWRAAYDEELEALGAFDFEAAPALFPESARANRAFSWPQTLVIDDIGEPWPALETGMAALFERAQLVVATLVIPGGKEEEVARRARTFWTKHGARFVEEAQESPRVRVARALLDPSGNQTPGLPPNVSLTLAHTPGDEAERIAAFIRREIEGGARASDFCLLVPDKSAQEPTLRAAFSAAGVALDFSGTDAATNPLIERLMRLLASRATWSVDELHDLFGNGSLRLEWSGEDGTARRFDAGRLRRAHRLVRGQSDEAPWHDAKALARDWEARIARFRASDAARGDQSRARTLALSLDGGDLDGVARLRALLLPLAQPLDARAWEIAALSVVDALAAHWEEASLDLGAQASCLLLESQEKSNRKAALVETKGGQDARAPKIEAPAPSDSRAQSGERRAFAPEQEIAPIEQLGAGQNSPDGHNARASKMPRDAMDDALRSQARAVLAAFRAGVRAVAERAGDETGERPASAWAAWLRLELSHAEEEPVGDNRFSGVRVLRVGEESEAHSETTRGVFVVGLTERAWPQPRPVSSWPRATALGLETLRENETPPLALALHGFARLLALPCPLHLSRAAWINGAESGASPLWEDLNALFPDASWPALESASSSPDRPTTRAHWLRLLAQSDGSGDFELEQDDGLSTRLRALDAMRRERASTEKIGVYDGVLGERGRELLQPLLARDEERLVVSPSSVEGYARCPIRFFFERVLGLPDESGTEDDLSRAESGDLVHRILHSFRREWPSPLGLDSFEQARELLAQLTSRECDSLALPSILRRAEARRLIGTQERPGALVRLLRAECLEADANGRGVWAHPLHPLIHLAKNGDRDTEWALAHQGNGLEQSFRLPLNGALVQGRIDRMDASSDGSLVVVLDYKTGSTSSLPSFLKGSDRLAFQLAVYVLAAKQLVSGWNSSPRIGAAYLSPRAGFAGWTATAPALGETAKGAMSEEAMEEWLADSRAQIERIASLIESGTFNLSLRSAKIARCDGCAQRAICGQKAGVQNAREGVHLGSNVVFLPERVEWSGP